jgi:hypothetical protein
MQLKRPHGINIAGKQHPLPVPPRLCGCLRNKREGLELSTMLRHTRRGCGQFDRHDTVIRSHVLDWMHS